MGAFTQNMGHMTPRTDQICFTLQHHAFLRGLSSSQIDALSTIARQVVFDENEPILTEGQLSSTFYLVTAGSVVVELRTPRFVVCVEALGPGQAFGWSALLEHQDTLFQVRARERTTALCLDGHALKSQCRADPALGVEILQRTLSLVAGRVRATEIRFAEMCGIRV
jgi:CRP/FNR family cyclic AMP-dependent transcriptional regulator